MKIAWHLFFFFYTQRRTVLAYLWSWAARVSMRWDGVHLTNVAFWESPHSTVQLSSAEVVCNNNLGIETMEREEIPAVTSSGGGKKKRRNRSWGARMLRAFTASPFTWMDGRCHTEPQNAVRGQWDHYERVQSTQLSMWQILFANFLVVYAQFNVRWDKRAFEENVSEMSQLYQDAPQGCQFCCYT